MFNKFQRQHYPQDDGLWATQNHNMQQILPIAN
jgi:hypothetical protein